MIGVPRTCTLPVAEQPLRVAEFDDLFAAALHRAERREPTWLRLRLSGDDDVGAATRDLLTRESRCCSFFDFDLQGTGDGWDLDIRVPPSQTVVLDGLAARTSRFGS